MNLELLNKTVNRKMHDIFFGQGEFVPPPEAPVFEPTWEEFKDPEAYIEKIRDVGERAGICKIRPPPSWQPPFAIDVENFRFTPRLQKINELEARSRMKMNFVDRLLKYWHLQGLSVKVPVVEKQPLDLFKLHKAVSEEGGFEYVCNERKWSKVADRLGYSQQSKGLGSSLRHHYERILYPYDLFTVGASVPGPKVKAESKPSPEPSKDKGKKNATHEKCPIGEKTVDQYFCEVCEAGDNDELMLLCDGCDDAYHTFCLRPALSEIPPGDWRCPRCIAQECAKPPEAYGFEEAANEYSLESFGAKADQFKMDYFKTSGQLVPTSVVEKEFWRLVNCLDEDVIVEYGADIHALEKGSGFPTEQTKHRFAGYEEYVKCGWNLNNLPVLKSSMLRYIDANISGMKVPWCYVGMCFSCFCWHTEDHWSYSINYMHWGEPKTWYGVPGSAAELLEECMQKAAGELFEHSPDLMHQLTTIINPNILMAYGVPIVRTDQAAGEFVITFPRSYHAGFNQGYNFAEAVNFCPSDWLPFGRGCFEHYRSVSRQCVFSLDELACLIASDASNIDIDLAVALADDLAAVIDHEKNLRSDLLSQGLKDTKRANFEKMSDDERECNRCQTTLYLSAVECPCKPKCFRCIDHTHTCDCKPSSWKLYYEHTADELDALLAAVKKRAACLPLWTDRVTSALNAQPDKRLDWKELKAFISEATDLKIPAPAELLRRLNTVVREAEECVLVAGHLTRRLGGGSPGNKMNLDEIKTFCARVDAVPCLVKEACPIKELLQDIEACQSEAKEALVADRLPSAAKVKKLIDRCCQPAIEIAELKLLKWIWQQASWLEDVEHSINDRTRTTLDALCRLIQGGVKLEKESSAQAGLVVHSSCVSAVAKLRKQMATAESVDKRVTDLMEPRCRPDVTVVKSLLGECDALSVHLPSADRLRSLLQTATKWTTAVESALRKDHGVHIAELEGFIREGSQIAVSMNLLKQLEAKLANVRSAKAKLMELFHVTSSFKSMLQALFPLLDESTCRNELKTRHLETIADNEFNGCCSDNALVDVLKTMEVKSAELMIKTRTCNQQKCSSNSPDILVSSCLLCYAHLEVGSTLAAGTSTPFCKTCQQQWLHCPSLSTVVDMNNKLKTLRVCLPAGKMLPWLSERATAWQLKAHNALNSEELSRQSPGSVTAHIASGLCISEEMQQKLEELLVSGILLGVKLEETSQICSILMECRQSRVAADVKTKAVSPTQDRANKKAKRKLTDDAEDECPPLKKESPKPKPQLKEKANGNNKKVQGVKKRSPVKNSGKKNGKSKGSDSDDNSDGYDICSAKKCRKPTGTKIDWVQCDGCELWFHLTCVGLTPDQVSDDDEQYHCNDCVRRLSLSSDESATCGVPNASLAQSSGSFSRLSVNNLPAQKDAINKHFGSAAAATATASAASVTAQAKDGSSRLLSTAQPRAGASSSFKAGGLGGVGNIRLSDCIEPPSSNMNRRPESSSPGWSSHSGGLEMAGRSLGSSSSYTFDQFLYTPWLAKSTAIP